MRWSTCRKTCRVHALTRWRAVSTNDEGHRGLLLVSMIQRCIHERGEERMRSIWPGFELRMKLATEEPRMIGQFDHLTSISSGETPEDEPCSCIRPR